MSSVCREPDQWSPEFIDFVSQCLVKLPGERATAEFLLNHEFIGRHTHYIYLPLKHTMKHFTLKTVHRGKTLKNKEENNMKKIYGVMGYSGKMVSTQHYIY